MAKFSLARVPFYIFAVVFCCAAAMVESILNDSHSAATEGVTGGLLSLTHLILMVLYGAWAVWSVVYLFVVRAGTDDDVGVDVGGVPAGKKLYYTGLLVGAAYRAVTGLSVNTYADSFESFYGKAWLIAALVLAGWTWANYRSFTAKTAKVTELNVGTRRRTY